MFSSSNAIQCDFSIGYFCELCVCVFSQNIFFFSLHFISFCFHFHFRFRFVHIVVCLHLQVRYNTWKLFTHTHIINFDFTFLKQIDRYMDRFVGAYVFLTQVHTFSFNKKKEKMSLTMTFTYCHSKTSDINKTLLVDWMKIHFSLHGWSSIAISRGQSCLFVSPIQLSHTHTTYYTVMLLKFRCAFYVCVSVRFHFRWEVRSEWDR